MGRVLLAEDDALRRKVALKTLKRTRRVVAAPLPARGARRGAGQPSQPVPHLRGRRGRRAAVPRHGAAARARRSPRGCGAGRSSPAEALDLAEDLLAAPRRPARRGRRAPGRQALEHLPDAARRQARRLRPRPRAAGRRRAHAPRRPPTSPARGSSSGRRATWRPEQILGHAVDARADLFAAGVVLYEALTGRRALRGGQRGRRALRHALRGPSAPRRLARRSLALDAPIRRALAKKPAERYASAREMAEALRAAARVARSRRRRARARGVRRPAGGARLARGAIRGGRRRRGQGRLRDRRARRRQERARRRVPAAGAHRARSR